MTVSIASTVMVIRSICFTGLSEYLCSSTDRAPGYEPGCRAFDSSQGYVDIDEEFQLTVQPTVGSTRLVMAVERLVRTVTGILESKAAR